jgi:hypothetical protein
MINPVMAQSELSGPRQLPPASPALMSCVPNSGFDSRDGGQGLTSPQVADWLSFLTLALFVGAILMVAP